MRKTYFNRVPRARVLAVTPSQLRDAFAALAADYKAHLKADGIKLPAERTAKWRQLAVLKHFQGEAVHKDDVSMLIAKLTGKPASDQQVRHLKTQGGWYVLNRGDVYVDGETEANYHVNGDGLNRGDVYVDGETETHNPDGCHVLITTTRAHPNATLGRRAAVEKGEWEKILEEYDHRCASCGTRIGEYHRFDSSFKVETLERGHMDTNKPLDAGNIIPQCRWCNRTARGDFVFDLQGRPRAVASVRPVSRADREVIAKIKKWLRDK